MNTAFRNRQELIQAGLMNRRDLFRLGLLTAVVSQITQKAAQVNMSNQLPLQTVWGFDGMTPGPTYVAKYGTRRS